MKIHPLIEEIIYLLNKVQKISDSKTSFADRTPPSSKEVKLKKFGCCNYDPIVKCLAHENDKKLLPISPILSINDWGENHTNLSMNRENNKRKKKKRLRKYSISGTKIHFNNENINRESSGRKKTRSNEIPFTTFESEQCFDSAINQIHCTEGFGYDTDTCSNDDDKNEIENTYDDDFLLTKSKKTSYKFDTHPIDADIVEACTEKLKEEGFLLHLKSEMGMSKSDSYAKTAIIRVGTILCYTFKFVHETELKEECTMEWLRDLIFKEYATLHNFCKEKLTDERKMNPASIGSYLNDLTSAAIWLISYWPHRSLILSDYQMTSVSDGFKHVKTSIRKCYSAAKKKQYANMKSYAQYVHDRKAPVGGLPELYSVVKSKLPWVQELVKQNEITEDDYRDFMRVFSAAIYVCAPNGRPQALNTLTMKQGRELSDAGLCLSSIFKTKHKYHYQPVQIYGMSGHMLDTYLKTIRPFAARGRNCDNDADLLMIMYDGRAADVGKLVSAFFEQEKCMSTNVTIIRTLLNTHSMDLYNEGKINQEQYNAVCNVNGHSSEIADNHYYLLQADKEAANAMQVFHQILGGQRDDSELWHEAAETSKSIMESAQWGSAHKDRNKHNKAGWSIAELKYIEKWNKSHPFAGNRRVYQCLKSIKEDKNAIPIFHQNHILKSDRLK